jgi:prepilin-type N-terminal cleavage/methylation domain-containing protein
MRARLRGSRYQRGVTLIELMIAVSVMAAMFYSISMIYFSVLNIYNNEIWKLPPYDAATAAVQRVSKEIREAMLVDAYGTNWVIVVLPEKDANFDNVLTLGTDGLYHLSMGDEVLYYLSDSSGSTNATGNCLWKAIAAQGTDTFVPKIMIADNIHPELNPIDPNTGQPYAIFKYWPDTTRLWGIEMWMTSTTTIHQSTKTQTAHAESFLRNL